MDSFVIRRPLPVSQLPTSGWANVFSLDDTTNTVCWKQVQASELTPDQVYDTLQAEIADQVSDMGFSPPPQHQFYFAFPDALRPGFRQLLDVCRGLPSTEPPLLSLTAAESAVRATTGVALLTVPPLRDILLHVALTNGRRLASPPEAAARQAETIATIALAGPASAERSTRDFRRSIFECRDGMPSHPRSDAALLRAGWRHWGNGPTLGCLYDLRDEAFARDGQLEGQVKALLELLQELQYYQHRGGPDEKILQLLYHLTDKGSLTVLRLVFDGYIVAQSSLEEESRTRMLLNAVTAAAANPDRQPMLVYLLEKLRINKGLMTTVVRDNRDPILEKALRAAVGTGDGRTVRLLRKNKAKLDPDDQEGKALMKTVLASGQDTTSPSVRLCGIALKAVSCGLVQ